MMRIPTVNKKNRSKYVLTLACGIIGYNALLTTGVMNKKNEPENLANLLNNNQNTNSQNTNFATNASPEVVKQVAYNFPTSNRVNRSGSYSITTPLNHISGSTSDLTVNSNNSNVEQTAFKSDQLQGPSELIDVKNNNSNNLNNIANNQNVVAAINDPNDKGLTLMKNYTIFSKLSQETQSNVLPNRQAIAQSQNSTNLNNLNSAFIQDNNGSQQETQDVHLQNASYIPVSSPSINISHTINTAISSIDPINQKEPMSAGDRAVYEKVQANLDNIILSNFITKKRADMAISEYVQHNLAPLMLPSSIPGAESEEEYYNRIQKEQRALSDYISKKYRIAFKAAQYIVEQAYEVGNTYKLDPKLVLALVATESRFNPLAESNAGAVGLTQSMQKWHPEKFERIKDSGRSEFSIQGNLDIGAQVLREYMKNYNGDTVLALQQYNGSMTDPEKSYSRKVLGIETELKKVADHIK